MQKYFVKDILLKITELKYFANNQKTRYKTSFDSKFVTIYNYLLSFAKGLTNI